MKFFLFCLLNNHFMLWKLLWLVCLPGRKIRWIFEKRRLIVECFIKFIEQEFPEEIFKLFMKVLKEISLKLLHRNLHVFLFVSTMQNHLQMFILPLMIHDDFLFRNQKTKQGKLAEVLTALMTTIKVYELSNFCRVIYHFDEVSSMFDRQSNTASPICCDTIKSNCLKTILQLRVFLASITSAPITSCYK